MDQDDTWVDIRNNMPRISVRGITGAQTRPTDGQMQVTCPHRRYHSLSHTFPLLILGVRTP